MRAGETDSSPFPQADGKPHGRLHVALLTNVISPYRLPVYNRLADAFDLTVLMSGKESNRPGWDDEIRPKARFPYRRAFGWTLRVPKGKSAEGVFDYRYIHINPWLWIDLARLRAQAVITNELGFRTLSALFYGLVFRKPVWVWHGGTHHTERNLSFGQRLVRACMMPFIKHWIAYGEAAADYLVSKGVKRERIVQIQNCVDDTAFSPDGPRAFDLSPKPVLLHVGQYIGRKGIDELLESAGRIAKNAPPFTLLFIGRGPEEDRLKQKAQFLGLAHVEFVPPKPSTEMAKVYRSADALVFPTKEDIWGLVVNEAILCGLPVLSSVWGGVTQELVPEENRFDPNDPEAFDRMLTKAAEGKLAASDRGAMLSPDEVSNRIIDDVKRTCRVKP